MPDAAATQPASPEGERRPQPDGERVEATGERFHLVPRKVRWWWWRRSDLQVWILKWGTAGFLVDLALFAGASLMLGSAEKALDVALGTASPFAFEGSWIVPLTVPLAILSWLLVPALTGAIIGALLDESVKYWTKEEAERVKSGYARIAAREAQRARRKQEHRQRRRTRIDTIRRRFVEGFRWTRNEKEGSGDDGV